MKQYANVEERFNITDTRGEYELTGNQESFLNKLKKIFKSKELKLEIEEIKKIIRKNQPDYTDEDILKLAEEISHSGCTYVAAAASILEELNYNEEEFYKMFGFPMKNKKGIINHDMLIAELYSFMKDRIKLEVTGKYETYSFETAIEAAKNLLGVEYKTYEEAVIAIVKAGYRIDGKNYSKFVSQPKIYMGNYKKILKEVTGKNISVQNIDEFKKSLNDNKIGFISDGFNYLNESKLSGLTENDFDTWLNYYFQEKGLDLQISSVSIEKRSSYEELVNQLEDRMKSGEVVTASAGHFGKDVNISMTDGSKLGWFNFARVTEGGHAMYFVGISDKGDFIVSSWGVKHMIPKEFWQYIQFASRKITTRNLTKSDSEEYIENQENVYKSIEEKINYINGRLNNENSNRENIDSIYNQVFSDKEKTITNIIKPIIKDELGNEIETSVLTIRIGEEYVYKVFTPGIGFKDVSNEYIENLIGENLPKNSEIIPEINQTKNRQ